MPQRTGTDRSYSPVAQVISSFSRFQMERKNGFFHLQLHTDTPPATLAAESDLLLVTHIDSMGQWGKEPNPRPTFCVSPLLEIHREVWVVEWRTDTEAQLI